MSQEIPLRTLDPAAISALALALLPCLLAAACSDRTVAPPPTTHASFCRVPEEDVERRIDALLPEMSLAEKVEQMAGSAPLPEGFWATPGNERLGIPPLGMIDGPRGVSVLAGNATAFPVAMARGASWDPEIERRVGEAIGAEARAKGASVLLAPTINLLSHPSWGRAQETYGEDPVHLSRFGVAFIEGAQQHVIASAKHFAVNSIENTRHAVSANLDERTLREVYLPHFRAAVQEARVGSVMSAYNRVNGVECSESVHLLRDILKDEWGFRGFVESDWFAGVHSTVRPALAGLDIEMPYPFYYGDDLIAAVERGEVPIEAVDDAVRRVLRVKLCFALDSDPPVRDPSVIESQAHTDLALEAAQKSIVLLKNEDEVLPLERDLLRRVAVTGPLADVVNLGDRGSSGVNPSASVTALAGLVTRAGSVEIEHVSDPASPAGQTTLAEADATVVVVGLTNEDEGEGQVSAGDRLDLALSPEEEELIRSVAALNPRTVVVLEGGSAILVEGWIDQVGALVMAWYPGMQGGNAIADVLFGDVSPGGKLPFTVPRELGDLPEFVSDPRRLQVSYGYYHGYRWVDHHGIEPRFPFGFGLHYTTFAYESLEISDATLAQDGVLEAAVRVRNTGPRASDEVVQLYIGMPASRVERAERELEAFARVPLESGEAKVVRLRVAVRDLAYYDEATSAWVVEPGTYTAEVGSSSRDLPLQATFEVR